MSRSPSEARRPPRGAGRAKRAFGAAPARRRLLRTIDRDAADRIIEVTPRRRRRKSRLALALAFVFGFGPGIAAADTAEATEHGADHAAGHGHHEDPSKYFNFFEGLPFGYTDTDKLGGPLGDGKLGDQPLASGTAEERMPTPFLLLVLNFFVLVLILVKYGRPAARKMAETRADQIKSALDEAARLRDDARAKLEEYSTRLAAADAEMTKMIEQVRADAEADRVRVIAAAEAQAAALKKEAEERIAAEIAIARLALAQEVAAAAAAAAEQLIRDKATSADHTKLVDGFIAEVGTGGAREEDRS
jgi:F-type H+-transporting ATPase subunit b